MLSSTLFAADGTVTLSCDYPGGNVKIVNLAPGLAEIAPDLRGEHRDWFYWNFDAVATKAGTVKFAFPVGVSRISALGPAVSLDGGRSWKWLGRDKTHFREGAKDCDSFEWTFSKEGERVRFAQGIPYQLADFEAFMKKHASSPYMKRTVLTKTRKGVETPMLIVGSGPKNLLVTARHHSCEAIASYALEGILAEALGDTPAGVEFRSKYTLYAVPFVDLDGVEAGDQGKGRLPHDHNRDYALGDAAIYPEIKALEALHADKKFFVTFDLHAPSIRGDVHEAIYFAGLKSPTALPNTHEFKAWLDEERPSVAGPIAVLGGSKVMKPSGDSGIPNSHYFGTSPLTEYAVTIEIAYASKNPNYNEKMIFQYGRSILRAFLKVDVKKDTSRRKGYAEYTAFLKKIKPGAYDATIKACNEALADKSLPPHYHTAAYLQCAFINYRTRNYNAAIADNEVVLASPYALASQKHKASVQKTEALCRRPETTVEEVNAWAAKMLADEYRLYDAFDVLYNYYIAKGLDDEAVRFARLQLPIAAYYRVGRVRNRISLYEMKHGDKAKAVEYARGTVKILEERLYPKVPVGVYGPDMVIDYVNALIQIPETTVEAVEKAAELAYNHRICYDYKRKALEKTVEKFKADRNR